MAMHHMIDGVQVECTPEEEKEIRAKWAAEDARVKQLIDETGYACSRKLEYPSIPDQLDMLWHAMDTKEIPMAKDFYNTIAAIKKKHPKPTTKKSWF